MMVADTDVPSSIPYYELGSTKPLTIKRSNIRSPIGRIYEKRVYTFQTVDGPIHVCDTSTTNILERAIETGGDISFVHFNADIVSLVKGGFIKHDFHKGIWDTCNQENISYVRCEKDDTLQMVGPILVFVNGVRFH
jgi:hypothetical protein